MCIAFVLASALSLLAQSDRMDVQSWDKLQPRADSSQPRLIATLVEAPAIDGVSSESELPDAPSAARPDASTAAPVKRNSGSGAPPAATGGPLAPDRSVTDRDYLLFTGAMFGASVANAELTLNCLQKHASCNDVPSSLHSRTALYGIGIPADLGIAYLTYYMKKKHNHLWFVPAAVVTGANVFFGVRAYRWAHD